MRNFFVNVIKNIIESTVNAVRINRLNFNTSNLVAFITEDMYDNRVLANTTFAFYRLFTNYSDFFENFGNMTAFNSPTFGDFNGIAMLNLPTAAAHVAADTIDYKAVGLVGVAGTNTFTVGCNFVLTGTLSADLQIWYAGDLNTLYNVGLYYDNTAKSFVFYRTAATTVSLSTGSAFEVVPNILYSVYVRYNGTNGFTEIFVDGEIVVTGTLNLAVPIVSLDSDNIVFGKTSYGSTRNGFIGYLGRIRIITGVLLTQDDIQILGTPNIVVAELTDRSDNSVTLIDRSWFTVEDPTMTDFTIPPTFSLGDYLFRIYNGPKSTPQIMLNIEEVPMEAGFVENFTDLNVFSARWGALVRQWGGANGGVVAENIAIVDEGGSPVLRLTAHGDNYTGDVFGTNSLGNPQKTRVGAVLTSRKYTGFGTYEMEAKVVQVLGAASTIWTFFYQEIYDNDPRYSDVQTSDGLRPNGKTYIIRNHEIDIELPSNIPPDPESSPTLSGGKFNAWRGVERSNLAPSDPAYFEEYKANFLALGFNAADNLYHKYRFDWYHDKVEFYLDNVLFFTQLNDVGGIDSFVVPDIASKFNVGVWFPDVWAGTPNFNIEYMYVKQITYTPFVTENTNFLRKIGETYVYDYELVDINV